VDVENGRQTEQLGRKTTLKRSKAGTKKCQFYVNGVDTLFFAVIARLTLGKMVRG
jgi:hypothetical protein